ncbi:MAG TPA: DNA recombination protein RmuC [Gaiellaceae bacterium]
MVVFAIGAVVGAALFWFASRARTAELVDRAQRLEAAERERAALHAELEHEQAASAEKIALLHEAKQELSAQFKALSVDALRSNSESFMQLASAKLEQKEKAVEHLVAPIKESLDRVGNEVKTLENARRQDYGSLTAQVRSLAETSDRLRSETGSLVTALRAPAVRGRWGEMQLRRAVEAAGMLAYCDFVEQQTVHGEAGALRPDLIVRLPGDRNLVVDAKAPLQALLDALDAADDSARKARFDDFVRHIRDHVARLRGKAYWTQFSPTPDFVIMFLPGESFYRAALEHDPSLLDLFTNDRVIVASPTTLITILRAVAVGWREEKVAESARAVNELGRELYERLCVMTEHLTKVGVRLDGAVQAYNQTVGSFERRVLVSARRFTELGVGSGKELGEVAPIERASQAPQTVELPSRFADDSANAA